MSERPRVYKTEGVILRRRNIGEADSVFTVYSDREGKFEGVARGVRKARSHMRGHLEPLTRSRLMLARGRSLDVFTQAETVEAYRSIREDLERMAAAVYVAELVERCTAEHAPHEGLYDLLIATFDALAAGGPPHVVRYFELHLLAITGYEVQLDACALCDGRLEAEETLFAAAAGGLVCRGCRGSAGAGRLLSVRAVKVLRYARRTSAPEFAALAVSAELDAELRQALGDFIRYVIEREPVAARFVDDLARLPSRNIP